jgi:lipoprotein-anchoring transpeptidase ErfK/SrfK
MPRRVIVAISVLAVVALGVGVGAIVQSGPRSATSKTSVPTTSPPVARTDVAIPAHTTLLASLHSAVAKFASPSSPSIGSIAPRWDGAPVTLPVVAQQPGWFEVRLPERPNGSTAWVRSVDVSLSYTPYLIVINKAETHLALEDRGRIIGSFPAGIGTSVDPTPTGQYFVTYFAEPSSPGYGPFVMVTSAHSNKITDWEHSGDAEIAIHGPLGKDAAIGNHGAEISHGCIRLHVIDLDQLRKVPVGTPVDIVE